MKARMNELGLHAADLAGLAGSGAAGRVTIQDFEKFLANLEKNKLTNASTMRVAVADAMRRSWTRPLATVALPCSLEAMLAHRKVSRPQSRAGALCVARPGLALAENSAVAGRLIGNKIVHPPSIDLGFAVEAEEGVLVPVLRKADVRPLSELVGRYNELVELARQRRLPNDATGGSDRHCDQFRHLRPDLGHSHSAAGTNPGARLGRGQKSSALGCCDQDNSSP